MHNPDTIQKMNRKWQWWYGWSVEYYQKCKTKHTERIGSGRAERTESAVVANAVKVLPIELGMASRVLTCSSDERNWVICGRRERRNSLGDTESNWPAASEWLEDRRRLGRWLFSVSRRRKRCHRQYQSCPNNSLAIAGLWWTKLRNPRSVSLKEIYTKGTYKVLATVTSRVSRILVDYIPILYHRKQLPVASSSA